MNATAKARAMAAVLLGVIDAVKEAGPVGAPGGVIYAGLMAQGCSLEQSEQIMAALVGAGRLHRRGDLYFATEARS